MVLSSKNVTGIKVLQLFICFKVQFKPSEKQLVINESNFDRTGQGLEKGIFTKSQSCKHLYKKKLLIYEYIILKLDWINNMERMRISSIET